LSDPVRAAFVQEVGLRLAPGADAAAAGAAVTVALCGHWEHEGPCRWPHNNRETITRDDLLRLRTIFVCAPDEEAEVRARIDDGLRASSNWEVVSAHGRPVAPDEQLLAARLAATPRL